MGRYVLKRIAIMIPTILVVILIIMGILSMTPGEPAKLVLGEKATPEQVAAWNAETGYDRPFLVRYARYVVNAFRGDLGTSWNSGRPIFKEIMLRLPTTAKLSAFAIVLAVCVGIPLGILSAVKQYSIFDVVGTSFAMVMASMPSFWFGMMLIILFSQKLGWLPSYGVGSFAHYILPSITLSCSHTATLMRLTRTTVLETIRQDYIRTARAKGQTEKIVIFDHALHNGLLPVVTACGTSFCALLGGVVTVETVFSINGLGKMIVDGIQMKDIPVVTGSTVFLSAMVMLVLLVVDVVYALIDPRIKAKYQKM